MTCKSTLPSQVSEAHTYLTPYISFADFQTQDFGKVLRQLCDTGILGREQTTIYKDTTQSLLMIFVHFHYTH